MELQLRQIPVTFIGGPFDGGTIRLEAKRDKDLPDPIYAEISAIVTGSQGEPAIRATGYSLWPNKGPRRHGPYRLRRFHGHLAYCLEP